MTNNFSMWDISPFFVTANKLNTTKDSPERYSASHIHDLCEIYVNLSGNVSFMVEKNVYTVKPRDIVITKPYEYHHCIYNDDSDHLHYWILFSPNENPTLFDFLLQKERGTDNLIRLPEEISDRFLGLCERLVKANTEHRVLVLAVFYEILYHIAKGMTRYNIQEVNETLPDGMKEILNYINKNHAQIKNVSELAETFRMSMATLERYFKKHVSLTPKQYLEDKKMATACILLRQGYSVTDACFTSGFDDYSHFIANFKKRFLTTPLKYKKNITKSLEA